MTQSNNDRLQMVLPSALGMCETKQVEFLGPLLLYYGMYCVILGRDPTSARRGLPSPSHLTLRADRPTGLRRCQGLRSKKLIIVPSTSLKRILVER